MNAPFAAQEAEVDLSGRYFGEVQHLLACLYRDETETVKKAASMMAARIKDDRLIHVFGAGGHSVIGCEEFFYRAGGLACVSPMFEASLLLSSGGLKSTMLERVPGVGDKIVRAFGLKKGDVMIITSIYGMNAATIDAALEAKGRGVDVIAITSRDHSSKTPPDFPARHPSRKNLFEIADVTIDNHVPHGDTIMPFDGESGRMGATSTILVSASVQWLCLETAQACRRLGIVPPVWRSSNTEGGDASNDQFVQKYGDRIRAL